MCAERTVEPRDLAGLAIDELKARVKIALSVARRSLGAPAQDRNLPELTTSRLRSDRRATFPFTSNAHSGTASSECPSIRASASERLSIIAASDPSVRMSARPFPPICNSVHSILANKDVYTRYRALKFDPIPHQKHHP